MFLHGCKFLREVPVFKIHDYTAHMGWISGSPTGFKIYSRYGFTFYYLHDEHLDKLFEFVTDTSTKLNRSEQLNLVIEAYYLKYPESRQF